MIIYMATNKINSKEYIGQTVNSLNYRKSQHISDALNKRNNMYFGRSLKKYGPENFDWEILHNNITNTNDLNKLEIYYIKLYGTYTNGYNLTFGGNGFSGFKHSVESRLRRSETSIGNQNGKGNKGNTPSKKARLNMSKAQLGNQNAKGNKGRRKPLMIFNQYFNTVQEAADFIGVTRGTIADRIKRQVEGYRFVYTNSKIHL